MFNADKDDDSDCEIIESDITVVCVPDNSDDECETAKNFQPNVKAKGGIHDYNLPIEHSQNSPFQPKLNSSLNNNAAQSKASSVACFSTTTSRNQVENYENVFKPILAANTLHKDLNAIKKAQIPAINNSASCNSTFQLGKLKLPPNIQNLQQLDANINDVFKVRFADNAPNNNSLSKCPSNPTGRRVLDPRLKKPSQIYSKRISPTNADNVFTPKLATSVGSTPYAKKLNSPEKAEQVLPRLPTSNPYEINFNQTDAINTLANRAATFNNDNNNNKTKIATDFQNIFKPRLAGDNNTPYNSISPVLAKQQNSAQEDIFTQGQHANASKTKASPISTNRSELTENLQNIFSVRLAADCNPFEKETVPSNQLRQQTGNFNKKSVSDIEKPAERRSRNNKSNNYRAGTNLSISTIDLCSSPESSSELQGIFKPKLAVDAASMQYPTQRNVISICSSPEEEQMSSTYFHKNKPYARRNKKNINALQSFNSTFKSNFTECSDTQTVDLSSSPEPETASQKCNDNFQGYTKNVNYDAPLRVHLADNITQHNNNKPVSPQKLRSNANLTVPRIVSKNTSDHLHKSSAVNINYENAFQVRLAETDAGKRICEDEAKASSDMDNRKQSMNHENPFQVQFAVDTNSNNNMTSNRLIPTNKTSSPISQINECILVDTGSDHAEVFKPRLAKQSQANGNHATDEQSKPTNMNNTENKNLSQSEDRADLFDSDTAPRKSEAWKPQTLSLCNRQNTSNYDNVFKPRLAITDDDLKEQLLNADTKTKNSQKPTLKNMEKEIAYENVFVPKLAVMNNNADCSDSIVSSSSDFKMANVGENVKNMQSDNTKRINPVFNSGVSWETEDSNDSHCLTIDETRCEVAEVAEQQEIFDEYDVEGKTHLSPKNQVIEDVIDMETNEDIDVDGTSKDNNDFDNVTENVEAQLKETVQSIVSNDQQQLHIEEANTETTALKNQKTIDIDHATEMKDQVVPTHLHDQDNDAMDTDSLNLNCSKDKQVTQSINIENKTIDDAKQTNSLFENIFQVPLAPETPDAVQVQINEETTDNHSKENTMEIIMNENLVSVDSSSRDEGLQLANTSKLNSDEDIQPKTSFESIFHVPLAADKPAAVEVPTSDEANNVHSNDNRMEIVDDEQVACVREELVTLTDTEKLNSHEDMQPKNSFESIFHVPLAADKPAAVEVTTSDESADNYSNENAMEIIMNANFVSVDSSSRDEGLQLANSSKINSDEDMQPKNSFENIFHVPLAADKPAAVEVTTSDEANNVHSNDNRMEIVDDEQVACVREELVTLTDTEKLNSDEVMQPNNLCDGNPVIETPDATTAVETQTSEIPDNIQSISEAGIDRVESDLQSVAEIEATNSELELDNINSNEAQREILTNVENATEPGKIDSFHENTPNEPKDIPNVFENVFGVPLAESNKNISQHTTVDIIHQTYQSETNESPQTVAHYDEIMQPGLSTFNEGSDNEPSTHLPADVFVIDSDVEEGEVHDVDDVNDSSIQIIDDNSDTEEAVKVDSSDGSQVELERAPIFEIIFSQKHYFDKLSTKIVQILTQSLNSASNEENERYELVIQNGDLSVQAYELQPQINPKPIDVDDSDVQTGPEPKVADEIRSEKESSGDELDLSSLFTIDTSPTKRIDAGQVPSYKKAIRDPLNDEATPSKRLKVADADVCERPRAQHSCFNCGSNEHSMRECTKPRNMKRIQKAKQQHQSRQERYHMDSEQRFAHLRPGKLSNQLKSALGLGRGEIPSFFYRMRVFGYPPGWLEDSKIDSSGLTLFVGKDKEVPAPNLDEGEMDEQVKYDIRKLIDFPGFNSHPGEDFYDDFKFHCVPPMHPTHTKDEFIKMLGDNVYKGYKQKKLKELPQSNTTETTELECTTVVVDEDMEIDDGEVNECIETERPPPPLESPPSNDTPPPPPPFFLPVDNEEVPPPPFFLPVDNEEVPPPPPTLTIKESIQPTISQKVQPDEENKSSSSENADKDNGENNEELRKSPSLAELEEQQVRLLNELETDDSNAHNAQLEVSTNEMEENSENNDTDAHENLNDANQVVTSNAETKTPQTPATPMASERLVRESHVGTPLCKFSPYDKLPNGDNFKVGVSDVINFENLPDSTGKYEKMKGVLKKVRNIVNEMQKREDD